MRQDQTCESLKPDSIKYTCLSFDDLAGSIYSYCFISHYLGGERQASMASKDKTTQVSRCDLQNVYTVYIGKIAALFPPRFPYQSWGDP